MKKRSIITVVLIMCITSLVAVILMLTNNNDSEFSKAGTYDYSSKENLKEDIYIKSDEVIIENMVVEADLYIDEAVKDGSVELYNVKVEGTLYVYGGGVNTIYIDDCEISTLIGYVDVRIEAKNNTVISKLIVKEPGMILENDESAAKAFQDVSIQIDNPKEEDSPVILKGVFEEVEVGAGANIEVEEQTSIRYFPLRTCNKESCPENYKTRVRVKKSAIIDEISIDGTVDIDNDGEIINISYGENASNVTVNDTETYFPSSEKYKPIFLNEPRLAVDNKGNYTIDFQTNNEGTVYYVIQPWFDSSGITVSYQDVESGTGATINGCGSASDPDCFMVASAKSIKISALAQKSRGSGYMGDKISKIPPEGDNISFDSVVWYVFKDKEGNYSEVGKLIYGTGYPN